MKKPLIGLLVVMVAVALGTYLYSTEFPDLQAPNDELISADPSPLVLEDQAANQDDVPDGWLFMESEEHEFSVAYPPEVEVQDRQDEGVAFLFTGATQAQGTELFDGYVITFRQEGYQDDSFLTYVQRRHAELEDEPATSEITAVLPVIVAGYSGFAFNVTGLGTFRHVYIPSGDKEALLITYLVADPENLGYQEDVDMMLSSLSVEM